MLCPITVFIPSAFIKRACSSVGQSRRLIISLSGVQVPPGPPNLKVSRKLLAFFGAARRAGGGRGAAPRPGGGRAGLGGGAGTDLPNEASPPLMRRLSALPQRRALGSHYLGRALGRFWSIWKLQNAGLIGIKSKHKVMKTCIIYNLS